MKRILPIVLFALLPALAAAGAPATMRVDYFHTGNQEVEMFSLDS